MTIIFMQFKQIKNRMTITQHTQIILHNSNELISDLLLHITHMISSE